MKPAPFEYFAPANTTDALAILGKHRENARPLAGGQSLVPLMNLRMSRPDVLVDLNGCAELAFVERRGDYVAYGAMTRQMDAERSDITRKFCPLIAQALAHAGPVAVRNRATIGGTLAHADRSAELPGVAVALGAVFVVDGVAGRREINAEDFVVDDLTTDIAEGEMLLEVRFPTDPPETFTTFLEIGNRQRDMAVAGIAARLTFDLAGICTQARLAAVGVESKPVRFRQVEEMLVRRSLDRPKITDAARHAAQAIDPLDDVHASAGYRREVIGALMEQALESGVRFGEARREH